MCGYNPIGCPQLPTRFSATPYGPGMVGGVVGSGRTRGPHTAQPYREHREDGENVGGVYIQELNYSTVYSGKLTRIA